MTDDLSFSNLVAHLKSLDEGDSSVGMLTERAEQPAAPDGQVRGKDKAPKDRKDKAAFQGKLVGEESKGEYGFLSKYVAEDELEEDLISQIKAEMTDFVKERDADEEVKPKQFNRGIKGQIKGIQRPKDMKAAHDPDDPLFDNLKENDSIRYGKPRKNEHGEWVIKAYKDGEFYEPATIYADNREEALDTMRADLAHMSEDINENEDRAERAVVRGKVGSGEPKKRSVSKMPRQQTEKAAVIEEPVEEQPFDTYDWMENDPRENPHAAGKKNPGMLKNAWDDFWNGSPEERRAELHSKMDEIVQKLLGAGFARGEAIKAAKAIVSEQMEEAVNCSCKFRRDGKTKKKSLLKRR